MGRAEADGAYIRLTPGRFTTEEEIDLAAGRFAEAAGELGVVYG